MALTLPGDVHAAAHARCLVDLLLRRCNVTKSCRDDVSLMITEACANAATHARPPGDIDLYVSVGPDECVIDVGNHDSTFSDARLRVDPPDPLAESGRGLLIISALADTTRIVHERAGWMVLRMVKRIARDPERP